MNKKCQRLESESSVDFDSWSGFTLRGRSYDALLKKYNCTESRGTAKSLFCNQQICSVIKTLGLRTIGVTYFSENNSNIANTCLCLR